MRCADLTSDKKFQVKNSKFYSDLKISPVILIEPSINQLGKNGIIRCNFKINSSASYTLNQTRGEPYFSVRNYETFGFGIAHK